MLTDEELSELKDRYTVLPGWAPGVLMGRHLNAAREALGPVYRHRLGKDGGFPEIGVVEVQNAQKVLAGAFSELDEYKQAMADILRVIEEVHRLKRALREATGEP